MSQVLLSDIAYIRLKEDKFCFLSLVIESYSHEIIGSCVGRYTCG
jgi:hypothetical protein